LLTINRTTDVVKKENWRKGKKKLQGNSKYEKKDRKTKETVKSKRGGSRNKKFKKYQMKHKKGKEENK
jgi:hypothetical protein